MKREPRWVAVFLKQLERTGNVRLAAERAGVDFSTAYQRRKRHAEFAERWEGAVRLHAASADRDEREDEIPPSPGAVFAAPPSPSEGEGLVARPDGKLIKGSEARWGKRAEQQFLTELTVSGSVSRAAKGVGFSTTALYRRRAKSRRFAAAWDAAVEAGKVRVQAYLVEAATRTFDPDELPIGDGREMPKVTIGEAINIAKLGSSTGPGRAGRAADDDDFITDPISREEWEQAGQNIVNRLGRLRERMEEEERETGRCRSCGQALPVERQG